MLLGEEEKQMQNNMPEKSTQTLGSHLAGVPAPLCRFLQGIALSSVPSLSGGKGGKEAAEESLDP